MLPTTGTTPLRNSLNLFLALVSLEGSDSRRSHLPLRKRLLRPEANAGDALGERINPIQNLRYTASEDRVLKWHLRDKRQRL